MNNYYYNNVISWALLHDKPEKQDSLSITRHVLSKLGIALPQGDLEHINDTLKSNDYMGWRKCSLEEALEAVENGIAAIGINDRRIVILMKATDSVDILRLTDNKKSAILKLKGDNLTDFPEDLSLYAHTAGTTNPVPTSYYPYVLIYRSRNRERYGFADSKDPNDVTPIINEDLTYGKKSAQTMLSNGSMVAHSDLYTTGSDQIPLETRVNMVKDFFISQIRNDETFTPILSDMLDHFVAGSGNDYEDIRLTKAVREHPLTKKFEESAYTQIRNCIIENNGNIPAIYYDENLWTRPIERQKHPIVKKFISESVYLPSYSIGNGVPGLSLAIDSWHGAKISLSSLYVTDNSFYGTLKYSLYDHFGLDTGDLADEKYMSTKAGYFAPFRQWYIMQHWDNLEAPNHPKPFVTKVQFSIPISGWF